MKISGAPSVNLTGKGEKPRQWLLLCVLGLFMFVGVVLFSLIVIRGDNPEILSFATDMSQVWFGALASSLASVITYYFQSD